MRRRVEPFLKWAGGKRHLLDQIVPRFPSIASGSTYHEPFVGGGAVFFGLEPSTAQLNDANPNLIEAYEAVRCDVDAVIESLRSLPTDKEAYYRIRASRPRLPRTRAARFIYLNKLAFNGLYRVNLRGEFNVPYGSHPENHVVCDEDQLRSASKALATATLTCGDFEVALDGVSRDDIVYVDPPYITSHVENGFVEYNAKVFAWEDQKRLAAVADDLVKAGVAIAVTNADHPSIRRLYPVERFDRIVLSRWSTMAADASKRYPTTEVLFLGGVR